MHELSRMAATEWAHANAADFNDAIAFGRNVAVVEFFCQQELCKLIEISEKAASSPEQGALSARNATIRVDEDGWFNGLGPRTTSSVGDEILKAAGFPSQPSKKPDASDIATTATPEQRANALELSAILSRYVSSGSVIDGANLLADKLTSIEGYERAAELIFRADLISSDAPLKSWGDLIKLADAVAVWLKTGEMSAGFSALQQASVSPLDAGVTLGDLVRHGLIRPPEDAPSRGLRTDPGRSPEALQAPRGSEPGSPATPGAEQ